MKVKIFSVKRILGSGLISIILTAILCGINWMKAANGSTIWGKEWAGGDCTEWFGFGVRMLTVYPESSIDNPIPSTTSYYFHPFSFIITLLVIFLLVYVLTTVISKVRENWNKI